MDDSGVCFLRAYIPLAENRRMGGQTVVTVPLWFLTSWVALGLGDYSLRFFRFNFAARSERLALAAALGYAALAYLVWAAGFAHLLYRGILLAGLVIGAVIFSKASWRLSSDSARGIFERFQSSKNLEKFLMTLGILVAFFSLSGALAPTTGQDELCYHLMQPKNYARAHAVYTVPYSQNSLWPYLMEMLFTLGIILDGAELAKLFHLSTALVTALSIYAFGRRFLKQESALWGAMIYWLTPAVFIQASFAYVDNALAAYVFLSAYAWVSYQESKKLQWAMLAGIFAGLAMATKLIGLAAPMLLVAAMIVSRAKPKAMAGALMGAVLAGGIWYVRAWFVRGNPAFPFYPQFFGGHGWTDTTYVDSHGRGTGLVDFFLLPWDVTLHPEWFGGEHIGPLYLMLFPLAFFLKPSRALRWTIFFALGYTALWFVIDPNIRFFFPGLALAAVSAGYTASQLEGWGGRLVGRLIPGILAAAFLVSVLFAPYHFWEETLLLFKGDKQRYLLKNERSFAAAQAINRHLGAADKILSTSEARGYYFDNPFTLEADLVLFTRYDEKLDSAEAVHDFLEQEGFTHVLTSDQPESVGRAAPLRIGEILKDPARRDSLFKEDLIVESGKVRYILYKIIK